MSKSGITWLYLTEQLYTIIKSCSFSICSIAVSMFVEGFILNRIPRISEPQSQCFRGIET